MLLCFTFCVLSLTTLQITAFTPQAKVYLGQEARRHEFGWMIRISDLQGQFICAGSILNEDWILTCSHCVMYSNPELLSVVAGDHDITTIEGSEHYHRALRVITHPEYSEDPIENDVALIKVSPPFKFDETIWSIKLPSQLSPDPHEAILIGWGYTEKGSFVSSTLKKTILSIVPLDECQKLFYDTSPRSNVNEKNVCAGSDGLCKGDSGGGLFYYSNKTPIIYGISSFGTYCGDQDHPGVFTRVSSHLDFIYKYVGTKYDVQESKANSGHVNTHIEKLNTTIFCSFLFLIYYWCGFNMTCMHF